MATPPPQPYQLNLPTILIESKRITKTHSRHFFVLSVLFLLPLSFSFPAYHYVCQLFSQSSTTTVETHLSFLFFPTRTIIFSLLYALYVLFFSLLAIGSITYSVFHGFYGRPVKLVSAVKSAFTSFPGLLSTCLVSGLIVSGFCLSLIALILLSLVKATQHFGFQVNFSSPFFIPLRPVFFQIIFICIGSYIHANWTFAPAVVIVESSWGLEPLKRSKYLVRGMRRVALLMFLVFGYLIWSFSWSTVVIWDMVDITTDKLEYWVFVILYTVFTSTFLMWSLLHYLAATTVFYVYSKAIHGEHAGENIAKEFPTEYVKLPFDDDEKVPPVASVV